VEEEARQLEEEKKRKLREERLRKREETRGDAFPNSADFLLVSSISVRQIVFANTPSNIS
jgi:hypothetical protein